MSVFYSAGK